MIIFKDNLRFYDYLDELINKTRNNEINWRGKNPTTYLFDKETLSGTLQTSIQKTTTESLREDERTDLIDHSATQREKIDQFLFQIVNRTSGDRMLFIDTTEISDREIYKKLYDLFHQIVVISNPDG